MFPWSVITAGWLSGAVASGIRGLTDCGIARAPTHNPLIAFVPLAHRVWTATLWRITLVLTCIEGITPGKRGLRPTKEEQNSSGSEQESRAVRALVGAWGSTEGSG